MDEEPRESTGFLPPQPAGPEPELGGRPPSPPPPPPGAQAPAPPPQQTYGYPPQPSRQWQPPPPPPAYWQPPPQQPQAYGQPWGYAPPAPDNNPAVAGFVLSIVGGGLLFFSAGLSSLVSIGCAVAGIVYSRKGKQRVAAGETPRHAGLAQAGFIIGWVSLVLAVLATIFWIVMLIVAINDPDAFDDSRTITAALRSLGS